MGGREREKKIGFEMGEEVGTVEGGLHDTSSHVNRPLQSFFLQNSKIETYMNFFPLPDCLKYARGDLSKAENVTVMFFLSIIAHMGLKVLVEVICGPSPNGWRPKSARPD